MPSKTLYTRLAGHDIHDLVPVLHSERVYAFIGGMPSEHDFIAGLTKAISGPPEGRSGEHWIDYVARLADTGEIIGTVAATVHDNLAEVAFLYAPSVWGKGYALEGLLWLHEHLRDYNEVTALWATSHPENHRSANLLRRAGYAEVTASALPLT